MTYTAVPTVATGDWWTARNHNQYVRDNWRESAPGKFAAAGDLYTASAAGAASLLSIGSRDSILIADAAEALKLKWSSPVVAIYRVDDYTDYFGNAEQVLNYGIQLVDTHSTVTTGGAWKFTAPHSGYYYVSANVRVRSDANPGACYIDLYNNTDGDKSRGTAVDGNIRFANVEDIIYIAANDWCRIYHRWIGGDSQGFVDGDDTICKICICSAW